jgi:TolB protein
LRLLLLLLILLCLPAIASAQTEVWPGIRTEEADLIPMWIEAFEADGSSTGAASQALEQIVFADLDFTGYFQITRGKVVAAGKNKEYAVVVRGSVVDYGGDLYFEGKVVEVTSGQFIGGKRYKLTDAVLRKVAHTFSDEVVYWLTGEKGIAGTQIVFTRKSGEDLWELLICDYDGYRPRTLLRQSTPIISPRWVDESKAIVYTSYRQGKPDLFIRYLSETKSRLIASYNGLNYSVDWSEEKRKLLATLSKDGNAEIYILRLDGRVDRRLTHNQAIDCSPIWSPTSREVLFTSDRSGSPQLYIMEADGSNVRRLTFLGSYNASSVWAPGADIIAFVSRIDGVFQLCSIRPDGSDQRLLTTDRVSHEDPCWAPDGRHLVYTERQRSGPVISVVDMTTGGKRILTQGEMPDWSLR